MASETAAEEQSLSEFMDMKYQMALDKFLENNPDKSEQLEITRVVVAHTNPMCFKDAKAD